MAGNETDLRNGVTQAGQRVLDVLDKSREAWGRLSLRELATEIDLAGDGVFSLAFRGPGGVETPEQRDARMNRQTGEAMGTKSAVRLAALTIYAIERAVA